MLDGWEQNGVAWAPATNGPGATDMSASLIFAANVAASGSIQLCAPYLFEPLSEAVRKLHCVSASESSLYTPRASALAARTRRGSSSGLASRASAAVRLMTRRGIAAAGAGARAASG